MDSTPILRDSGPRQPGPFIRPSSGPSQRPILRRFPDPPGSARHATTPGFRIALGTGTAPGSGHPGTARPPAAYQIGALNPIPAPCRLTSLARILTLLPWPRPRYRVERPPRSLKNYVSGRTHGNL
jgi:hypothetical protein